LPETGLSVINCRDHLPFLEHERRCIDEGSVDEAADAVAIDPPGDELAERRLKWSEELTPMHA